MSSLHIRQLVDQWATALNGRVPFYPTVNKVQDPKDDIWLTIEYDSFGATKETFCDSFVEDGEIMLVFFGRVGVGYATLMTAAEDYAKEFYKSTDPLDQLVLISLNPPIDYGGENSPWFVCEIAVDYQYRGN